MSGKKKASVHFDRDTKQFVGIDAEIRKHLCDAFRDVDVDAELSRMVLWLCSNRGKKRKGDLTFITNWLRRASPYTQTMHAAIDLITSDCEIGHLLRAYCEELWKDRQHILEFNTKRP